MPAKMARSAPRPPSGLTEVTVAVRIALLPCREPGKPRVFMAARESSGESRLMRLRAAAPMLLTDAPGGILTFPSFHATVAILTPLALRRYRGLFVVLLIFDAAMLCGTVTEGAHYVSDVLAGIGVAFCAYSLARRIIRVEDRSLHHYRNSPSTDPYSAARVA
jgi:hypothetical protein